MQKKSQQLMDKLDSNVTLMVQKYQSILELVTSSDKSIGTQSVETLQIESNASTIIRLSEELLSMTRTLKESWVLGQLPKINEDSDLSNEHLREKMNQLLELVSDETKQPKEEESDL
ncbi:Kinetochore protein [Komagataella phaffii CBS 7435]|uniref:Mediator of RNA polymerase II transcription subunit 22 n=2 Tax=Komagataella phaffii TaxID=460519 RepID=C4R0T0_KOMPG|nr:Hypothetical protein PAS_chr2-1_0474 [Komagataella phaffii GS115]CAH2448376.1 Kinetochore protein [Komagataella phaffii CBS 7435]CAY69104.1 Hypothetical protein PAS_chr2-1_0474 [Komagataella phaffii GS115]SCV12070.1 Kinetochore protein [Komagataella phaffii CBS 7435]